MEVPFVGDTFIGGGGGLTLPVSGDVIRLRAASRWAAGEAALVFSEAIMASGLGEARPLRLSSGDAIRVRTEPGVPVRGGGGGTLVGGDWYRTGGEAPLTAYWSWGEVGTEPTTERGLFEDSVGEVAAPIGCEL